MSNLLSSEEKKDFYVWLDLGNPLVLENAKNGHLFSVKPLTGQDNLSFLPNEAAKGFLSLFQHNITRRYMSEYNLELSRRYAFNSYPSRLIAVYLLPTKEEAMEYQKVFFDHVGNRQLVKVHTLGNYHYSIHDTNWIDFLNLGHSMDQTTISNVTSSYWSGDRVCDCELVSMGKKWSRKSITEILYDGNLAVYKGQIE